MSQGTNTEQPGPASPGKSLPLPGDELPHTDEIEKARQDLMLARLEALSGSSLPQPNDNAIHSEISPAKPAQDSETTAQPDDFDPAEQIEVADPGEKSDLTDLMTQIVTEDIKAHRQTLRESPP